MIDEKTNMEHWCNDIGGNAEMFGKKNLFQCHFVHQSPHSDRLGTKTSPKT